VKSRLLGKAIKYLLILLSQCPSELVPFGNIRGCPSEDSFLKCCFYSFVLRCNTSTLNRQFLLSGFHVLIHSNYLFDLTSISWYM